VKASTDSGMVFIEGQHEKHTKIYMCRPNTKAIFATNHIVDRRWPLSISGSVPTLAAIFGDKLLKLKFMNRLTYCACLQMA
jgi:hypothetical protein